MQKKNTPVSQSTSDAGSLESTDTPSAYAPRSISKNKIPFNTEFEKRINQPKQPYIKNADGSVSTHKMAWDNLPDGTPIAFPTIVNINGELKELKGDEAWDYAVNNKEYKTFKTNEEAENYAGGEYKKGTPLENFKPQSISKNKLQPDHKVVKAENIYNSTRDNFLNNPLFQEANPNAAKNKDIYLNTLSKSGFDKEKLSKLSADIDGNRARLKEASLRLNGEQFNDPFSGKSTVITQGNPKNYVASYDAGTALLGLGKPDDAIAMFNTTLGNLSDDEGSKGMIQQNQLAMNTQTGKVANVAIKSLFGLGSAYGQKGDFESSIASYNDALSELDKTDPDNESLRSLINKGLAYSAYKSGDKAASKEFLSQAKKSEFAGKVADAPFNAMATQIGEEGAAEKEQQRQADYMNDIADGMESFISGDIKNKFGTLGYLNFPMKIVSGIQEGSKTIGDGLSKFAKGSEQGNIDKVKSSLLTVADGGVSTIFAAIPAVTAFNAGISVLKDAVGALPEGGAKHGTEAVEGLEKMFFGTASLFAESLGYTPDEGSDAEKMLHLTDVVASMAMMGGAHKAISKVEIGKGISELKRLSEEAAKTGDISKLEEIKSIYDKAKDLNINDIKAVLEKEGSEKSKEILVDIERDNVLKEIQSKREKVGVIEEVYDLPDNVFTTLDRIEADSPVDHIQLKEAKDQLFEEYQRLNELKKDKNRMFTIDQINESMEILDNAASSIDRYADHEASLSPKMAQLRRDRESLKGADVSDLMKPYIEDAKLEVENKIREQAKVDGDNIMADASELVELNEVRENIKVAEKDMEVNAGNPAVLSIAEQKVNALKSRKEEIKAKRAADKEAKKFDYTKGKRAEEKAIEGNVEFSSPEEAERYILENSENPAEIATEFLNLEADSSMGYKSDQIEKYGFKMTDQEFNQNYDKNKKNYTLAKKYIDNKRKSPLDVQLMELSEMAGMEITEKDLFEHIDKTEFNRSSTKGSDIKTKFKSKFYELTGKELEPKLAQEIVRDFNNKNIEKYEQYITRENLTAAVEEQLYYEGLKNGSIPTFDSERYGNVPRDKKVPEGAATKPKIENPVEVSKPVEKVAFEPTKPISEKAKALADKIRSLKHKEQKIFDAEGNEIAPVKNGLNWGDNDIVEAIASGIERTGDIAQAVVDYLNEQDWFKKLSDKDKKAIEKQGVEFFSESVEEKLPDLGNHDAAPKNQKLGDRTIVSDVVNKEIKQGLLDKGIEYIPLKIEISKADAKEYVESMSKAGELDKAVALVTNMLKSDPKNLNERFNRGLISAELFEKLMDKSNSAKKEADRIKYRDQAIDMVDFAKDNFTAAGKELNAAKVWKRMMERTPDGMVQKIRNEYAEKNQPMFDAMKSDIKDAKAVIDEFIASKEFKDMVGEKAKAEIERLNKKNLPAPKSTQTNTTNSNIFNSKKVRDSRKVELMAKWRAAKGSASSSIVGLNKEQVEVVGEMALIHIVEGVVKASELAFKLKESLGITPEQFKELWENVDVAGKKIKEYAEEKANDKLEEKVIQKAMDVFSGRSIDKMEEKAYKDAVKQLLSDPKSELYKKLTDKLSKVKPENRKKILGDILAEVESVGGLSDKRFQEIYGEAFGLKSLSRGEEVKIRGLIETINKVEKVGEELSKAILGGASKAEISKKKAEWEKATFEAQKANGEVSQYFKADKRIGNTVASFIQAGLLTSMSLLKNVYSNTLMIPTRSARRGISSAVDYLISKATNTPRTIDAWAYFKGAMRGVRPGVKVAFQELVRGVNPEKMIERDYNQTLEPLKAMYSFVAGLRGKEKTTMYKQVNNFMEGTFGMPAEAMFRLLNLGDKPNRVAAEYGAAYEMGTLKGLKGKELENFVLFPDELSAKEIKIQGERAVFQQTEGLTGELSKGLKKFEDVLSNNILPKTPIVGDILKVLFKSQLPYKKTPLNILGETVKLVLPELSVAEGLYHSLKTGDRKRALESFSNAVVGYGIREGVKALVANNLVTGAGDYRDKEGNMIQQQNVAPNSLNISGMQRMFSGGSPAAKDSDTWINFSNMGPIGIFLGVHSELKGVPDESRGILADLSTVIPAMGQYTIEQSFLAGMNNFLTALADKEGRARRKWGLNTLSTLGAAYYPNSLATVSKAKDDYVRELKDEDFATELVNTFKSKMFMGDNLPSKVNLWGEKITGAPEGRSKMLWYLMDVTKFRNVPTESFNYKVFSLWNSVEDKKMKNGVLPNVPLQKITIKGESVKLTPAQYEKYQIYTGKNRAALVRDYAESPNWEKDSQEKKIKKLGNIYSSGLSNAKRELFRDYPELKKKKVK